jgi:hypothetical protein
MMNLSKSKLYGEFRDMERSHEQQNMKMVLKDMKKKKGKISIKTFCFFLIKFYFIFEIKYLICNDILH